MEIGGGEKLFALSFYSIDLLGLGRSFFPLLTGLVMKGKSF